MNQMSTFITTAYLDWWGNNGGRKMKQRGKEKKDKRGREKDNKIYLERERYQDRVREE